MYIATRSRSRFLQEMRFENNRLLKALRIAFYPFFETAESKRFEALRREAQDARNSGDFAGAEQVYLRAMAEARLSSDPSQLNYVRHYLAHLYQEQKRYEEAESLFHDQLDEALKPEQPNTQLHGVHMGLARLYQEQGKVAQAEDHYTAALAAAEELPDREFHSSTALWVAKFYVEQHRYSEAEPLFKRVVEIREAARPSDTSVVHYLHDLAKVYEAQEKHTAAEETYRRSLMLAETLDQPKAFDLIRAIDELAQFLKARGRFAEAEELSRRSLALVEEKINKHTAAESERLQRRPNDKKLQTTIDRARIPLAETMDRLAKICEGQDKYAESVALRRRSLEIREKAWGEDNSWIWVDSLAAYAVALRKIDREEEAAKVDERVKAIRTQYPQRRAYAHVTSRPLKRTLSGRFRVFIQALRYPSPR
jgi:tetratricopeptide (TPR) repeat protein